MSSAKFSELAQLNFFLFILSVVENLLGCFLKIVYWIKFAYRFSMRRKWVCARTVRVKLLTRLASVNEFLRKKIQSIRFIRLNTHLPSHSKIIAWQFTHFALWYTYVLRVSVSFTVASFVFHDGEQQQQHSIIHQEKIIKKIYMEMNKLKRVYFVHLKIMW